MAKVADAGAFRVTRNRVAWLVSLASLINLSSTPLSAYISESFPWTLRPSFPETVFESDSDANLTRRLQRLYNSSTLPLGATYVVDGSTLAQVGRQTLHLGMEANLTLDKCISTYLLGLPGLIFYRPKQLQLVCTILSASNSSTVLDWAGACTVDVICAIPYGRSCLWLTPGDDIHNTSDAQVVTLTYASLPRPWVSWAWIKLVYRLATTLLVWHRLWHRYYVHVLALEATVRRCGHRHKPGAWTYEVLAGDPTAIVLLDPWIASAFYIDVWLSVTNLAMAVIQQMQSANFYIKVLSATYLSRTVWFAYWSLCLVSRLLKRYAIEHKFSEVDPTLLAIAVSVYGPVLTSLNGQVPFMVAFYQWSFAYFLPVSAQDDQVEVSLAILVYTLNIAILPVLYGFCAPLLRHCCCRASRRPNYSSYTYSNFKSRLVFDCFRLIPPGATALGGNVHQAIERDPHLKRCPTISLRATDCFLTVYCNGQRQETLRLSLLCCMDTQSIGDASTASSFPFNVLTLPPQAALLVPQTTQPLVYEIQRPNEPSAWCL
ncbi:hypothetical protein SDRG_11409 [Saprolegnia diclina VS20]|uniref:Transmembrane protein n=1 Tax=Saprolegnia diclina (strain VS20) TaxID=1156394 RepID=T0Q8J1_SAPDV|nr:hypothetical protein SDRG_11409 [Saprolegnia diclina VS20]EQC30931.1 hypothetical protein SDRG_11409 [Saprolegnia diclina VS20]|eukprot:XP_008615669.1 hypothetical protein SDRG_11409 [Saprolegnia diclina VS20]